MVRPDPILLDDELRERVRTNLAEHDRREIGDPRARVEMRNLLRRVY